MECSSQLLFFYIFHYSFLISFIRSPSLTQSLTYSDENSWKINPINSFPSILCFVLHARKRERKKELISHWGKCRKRVSEYSNRKRQEREREITIMTSISKWPPLCMRSRASIRYMDGQREKRSRDLRIKAKLRITILDLIFFQLKVFHPSATNLQSKHAKFYWKILKLSIFSIIEIIPNDSKVAHPLIIPPRLYSSILFNFRCSFFYMLNFL